MNYTDVPDLSTRQIQAVLAVAEYRSFIAASAHLRMSQPALSRIVQRVEDVLGIAMFERSTRSVEITQAGHEFIAMSERILNDLKLSSRSLRDLIDEKRGQVILSTIMSIANSRLPGIIANYRASRPAIEIFVREGVHGQALEEVRGGSVDFGLSYIDDLPSGVSGEHLGEEEFYLAMPEGHPLRS
ncbi:LysR family transcriptional regulator [Pararhodobacter oceanensis]|uniref:LysR family transcriptional regulator n=1 Tax=Pararhodobacter oceanensis TaxID=2172121 RepID=UPI003A8E3B0E